MSRLTSSGQLKYTHDSNYITETLLKLYDVEEIPNGTLPLKFPTINYYQWEYPGIKSKLKSEKY